MTWWHFVRTTAPGASNSEIARKLAITPSSVGRWAKGSIPDPAQAAAFARLYGKPVLAAFRAAGYLTAEEAAEQPAAAPSLGSLSDDELLAEVGRRMKGGGSDDRKSDAQKRGRQVNPSGRGRGARPLP